MTTEVVFNTGQTPVTVNDDGLSVGGGEWKAVDTSASRVQAAMEKGILVVVPRPDNLDPQNVNVAAAAAFSDLDKVEVENDKGSEDEESPEDSAKDAPKTTRSKKSTTKQSN